VERTLLPERFPGWIDPCPFWDDDGRAWLIHAFAFSRSGVKNKLQIFEMAPDASRLLDNGRIVVDGTPSHPTLEGPKLYKRNGEYWIFARPEASSEAGKRSCAPRRYLVHGKVAMSCIREIHR
jgi:beta-xylosidase